MLMNYKNIVKMSIKQSTDSKQNSKVIFHRNTVKQTILKFVWNYCRRRNETPTLQSGLNFIFFNTCFLQLLYSTSLAQQPTGQAAKHYDLETIQCAGAGRDNLYFDLFTAAKTLFWGTSLST